MSKIGPWLPSKYTIADVAAVQAVNRGDADEYQQKRALKFIIETLARTYDEQYYPDSSRDTDYALGMRKVGQQIVKCIKLDLSELKKKEEKAIKGSDGNRHIRNSEQG